MKKINWSSIRLVLMLCFVVFLFSFTSNRNKKRKVEQTQIVFVQENAPFVKQETVDKLLIENSEGTLGIEKDKLDLNKLEKVLDSHQMIEKSEVFVTIDGVLKAVVKQKTPIVRVFDGNSSFYIDYEGNRMPLSPNFTSRIPLVFGTINTKNKEALAELFRKVYDDDFLKKNIIAIQILPSGSLKLRNRNYEFEIDFGGVFSINQKLNNYKAFYQKAILDNSLNQYKTIDLRFTDQVICTK